MGNIYVNSAATGSGTGLDWTNAKTQVPTNPARGDVIYVAAGTGYVINFAHIADSGTTKIVVKKATVADHGTSTGWSDSFASGQAIFTTVKIAINYCDFDGVTGGGGGITTLKSGHGFRISNTADTILCMLSDKFGAANDRVDVHHVYIAHCEMDSLITPGNCEGINLSASGASYSNITIYNCYLHDIGDGPLLLQHTNTALVEGCWIGRNGTNPDHHGVLVRTDFSDNLTFKNCWFEDGIGTGFLGAYDGVGDNFQIYGCVFCYSPGGIDPNAYAATGGGGAGTPGYGNGVIYSLNNNTVGIDVRNWKIHHNTFVNLPTGNCIYFFISASGGNVAYNNLFYNADTGWSSNLVTLDYNAFGDSTTGLGTHQTAVGSDPFVNFGSQDFRLATNITSANPLGAPYNVDMYGNTRNASTPSFGAIEFGAGGGGGGGGITRQTIKGSSRARGSTRLVGV
jgi:hypothetical protein